MPSFDTDMRHVQHDAMAEPQAGYGDSSECERPAFTLQRTADPALPILIAAPHGGRDYSPDIIAAMRDPEYSTIRLEDRYIDCLARDVADRLVAPLLVATVPRAVMDLNRAPEDVDWSMVHGAATQGSRNSLANRRARGGLGLIPRRLQGQGEIWKRSLDVDDLAYRMATIHRPYHSALGTALESIRDKWGAALLIDLHSMPPLKPNHPGERMAEFVIGDRFGASCDPMLIATIFRYFARTERPAAHNRPYSGGYILDRHAQPARDIHAIQVEVCRSLYLDDMLDAPSDRISEIGNLLTGLVRELSDEVVMVGQGHRPSIAAE